MADDKKEEKEKKKDKPALPQSYVDITPSLAEPEQWISTGSRQIDALMGRGIPKRRIVEFFGPPGSRKSTLCISAVANAQKHNFYSRPDSILVRQAHQLVVDGNGDLLKELMQPSVMDDLVFKQKLCSLRLNGWESVELPDKESFIKAYDEVAKKRNPDGTVVGQTLEKFRYEQLKTLLSMPVYDPPKRCYWYASEVGGFLEQQAVRIGVNLRRLKYDESIGVVEDLFSDMGRSVAEACRDGLESLIVIDSLTMYPTKNEKYNPQAVGMFGDQAKVVRMEWKQHHKQLINNGATVLAITHESGTGTKTGGVSTGFISSIVLRLFIKLEAGGKVSEEAIIRDAEGDVKNVKVSVRPSKNRTGDDTKVYSTEFCYQGPDLFDPPWDTFRFMEDNGILENAGAYKRIVDPYRVRDFKSFYSKDWVQMYKDFDKDDTWTRLEDKFYNVKYKEVEEARKLRLNGDEWY